MEKELNPQAFKLDSVDKSDVLSLLKHMPEKHQIFSMELPFSVREPKLISVKSTDKDYTLVTSNIKTFTIGNFTTNKEEWLHLNS